jgi:uncharacterized cupredoxin-like copper-binding protein
MAASLLPGSTTFEITNDDEAERSVEVESAELGIEEELEMNLQPGESATLEVDLQPGTYGVYRVYRPVGNHEEQGMRGELTVAEAGP